MSDDTQPNPYAQFAPPQPTGPKPADAAASSANPYAQFAQQSAGGNPYAQFSYGDAQQQAVPKRGAIAEIANQLKAGFISDLPKMGGQMLQYAAEPGEKLYDIGKSISDYGRAQENRADLKPQEDSHNFATNALAAGARMIPQSIVPAMAVGLAIKKPTAALPMIERLGIGSALSSLPAAMSQGQQTLDKAHEKGGIPEDQAREAARITALEEGLGETIGTMGMGKLFGLAGRALARSGVGTAAEHALEEATSTQVLKPFLRELPKSMAIEVGTEMGQNASEAETERRYGIDKESPWESAKQAIGPTIGMTVLLAPFGLAGHAMDAGRRQHRNDIFTSPESDQTARQNVVDEIAPEIAKIDPVAERNFRANAARAIAAKQPLVIDGSLFADPSNPPAPPAARPLNPDDPSAGTDIVPENPMTAAAGVAGARPRELWGFRTEELAQKQADSLTRLDGIPYQVGPHPTQPGKFAAMPVQQPDAEQAATAPLAEAADVAPDAAPPAPPVGLRSGEPVQVTLDGVDMFPNGTHIVGLSDDGQFAMVEGSDAAVPVSSITRIDPAGAAAIDAAGHQAATSDQNDRTPPTEAQMAAGNYKKGAARLQGLNLMIENPPGTVREGVSPDGEVWSTQMKDHYGYISGTKGADGSQVDAYIGPNPASHHVFIVDQIDQDTGDFDEHKVMLGYNSPEQARQAYEAHYSQGWQGGENLTATTVDGLKQWLKEGDTTRPYNPAYFPQGEAPAAPAAAKAPADALTTPAEQQAPTLTGLLQGATRQTNIKGMEGQQVADPIAQDLLKSPTLPHLERALNDIGVKPTGVIGAGASSIVLDAGDKVVRVGRGENVAVPKIDGMIQPVAAGQVDGLRYQIMPKADTKGITQADVDHLQQQLASQGYEFSDAGTDNVGRINGKPVVIDPGAIRELPTHDRPLADKGLTSYRYKGPMGWVMIGAKDHADAMREANRSLEKPGTPENLQVWDGKQYVAIDRTPAAGTTPSAPAAPAKPPLAERWNKSIEAERKAMLTEAGRGDVAEDLADFHWDELPPVPQKALVAHFGFKETQDKSAEPAAPEEDAKAKRAAAALPEALDILRDLRKLSDETRKAEGKEQPKGEAKAAAVHEQTRDEYRRAADRGDYKGVPAAQLNLDKQNALSLMKDHKDKIPLLGRLLDAKGGKDLKKKAADIMRVHALRKELANETEDSLLKRKAPELKDLVTRIGKYKGGTKADKAASIIKWRDSLQHNFDQTVQDLRHRAAVLKAIREGKTVPEKVMADYPNIGAFLYERGTKQYQAAVDQLARGYVEPPFLSVPGRIERLRNEAAETLEPDERNLLGDIADSAERLLAQLRHLNDDTVVREATEERAWMTTPFADRIRTLLGQMRDAGEPGLAKAFEGGFQSEAKAGRLTEQRVAFGEAKARELAAKAAPAQQQVHEYDPEQAKPLLIVACGDKKLAGRHRAIDLYQGGLAQMLHKYLKDGSADVYILSAKHGLVAADTVLDSYDQKMTDQRQQELLARGVDVDQFKGKNFSEVFVAGGKLYTELGKSYAEQLRAAGFVGPDAAVKSTTGFIGHHRQQLGEYLRQLSGEQAAEAPADDAQKPSAKVSPRDKVRAADPFLALIAGHGVRLDQQSDLGLEKGNKGNRMVPGFGPVLRNNGLNLDELALAARDAGYMTQQDIDNPQDPGGTRKVSDLIRRAVAGREVIPSLGEVEHDARQQAQDRNEAELRAQADAMGIAHANLSTDEVYDAVRERLADNLNVPVEVYDDIEKDADALQNDITDDKLDRALDAAFAQEPQPQALTDEQLDEVFGVPAQYARVRPSENDDAGAPRAGAETAESPADPQAAEPAAKLTPDSQGVLLWHGTTIKFLQGGKEREGAVSNKYTVENRQNGDLIRVRYEPFQGKRNPQAGRADIPESAVLGITKASPWAPKADDFALAGQTLDEGRAAAAAEEARKEAEAKAEREAERRAKADQERDSFTLTGSDRPADVLAAQGQTSIFDLPAEPAQPKEAAPAPQAKPAAQPKAREAKGQFATREQEYERFKHLYTLYRDRHDKKERTADARRARAKNAAEAEKALAKLPPGILDVEAVQGFLPYLEKDKPGGMAAWIDERIASLEAKALRELSYLKAGDHKDLDAAWAALGGKHGQPITRQYFDLLAGNADLGTRPAEPLLKGDLSREQIARLKDPETWTGGHPEGLARDLAIFNSVLGKNNATLPAKMTLAALKGYVKPVQEQGGVAAWHFFDMVQRRIESFDPKEAKKFKEEVAKRLEQSDPPAPKMLSPDELAARGPVEPLALPAKLPSSTLIAKAIEHVDGEANFRRFAQAHLNDLAEAGFVVHKDELSHEMDLLASDLLSVPHGDKDAKFREKINEENYPPLPGRENATLDDPGMERLFHLFPEPGPLVNAAKQAAGELLTHEQALARLATWKAEAKKIGETDKNHKKVILSLFDSSGVWSQPYADAGYTVLRYDLNHGDNLVENFPMHDIVTLRAAGYEIAGVIAQPPCTSFSNAGRWSWPSQHQAPSKYFLEKKYGAWATKYFDTAIDAADTLGMVAQTVIEFAAPTEFYVMENPRGRIAERLQLPDARMVIQPHVYGNAYTKETFLYGEFNTDLPTANVSPKEEDGGEGSRIFKLRGTDAEEHALRSLTPEGFAYAWFMANHDRKAVAERPKVDLKADPNYVDALERIRTEGMLDRIERGQEKPSGWYGDADQPLRFESGMSAPNDFEKVFANDKHVGISLKELSEGNIERLAKAMAVTEHAHLFVDTGAFSLYNVNAKARASGQTEFTEFGEGGKALNFDKILDLHDALARAISQADPTGFANDRTFFVMPDVVGNQALSLELVSKYGKQIRDMGQLRAIVPLQGGPLTLTQAYEDMMTRLGWDPKTDVSPVIGIPSAVEGASNQEVTDLLKAYGDNIMGVHILGAATESKLAPRLAAIREAGYDGNVSADAVTLRAKMSAGTSRAEAFRKIAGDLTLKDVTPGKQAVDFVSWDFIKDLPGYIGTLQAARETLAADMESTKVPAGMTFKEDPNGAYRSDNLLKSGDIIVARQPVAWGKELDRMVLVGQIDRELNSARAFLAANPERSLPGFVPPGLAHHQALAERVNAAVAAADAIGTKTPDAEARRAARRQAWSALGERVEALLPRTAGNKAPTVEAFERVASALGISLADAKAAHAVAQAEDASLPLHDAPTVSLPGGDTLFSRTPSKYAREKVALDQWRVLKRDHTNLNPEEKAAFDAFVKERPDGKRVLAQLNLHRGTPWARQALEGIFVRQAILAYTRGETPNFQSMMEHPSAESLRAILGRHGMDGLMMRLDETGYVGDAEKPVHNVSSSFINCSPSEDCAKYCYATGGHYTRTFAVIKAELVTLAVEHNPIEAAKRTAKDYMRTWEFENGKALRLFDKGDGNSAWLPYIQQLNKEGVRVQIFSKNPEFLRQVPDMNLRLLSIDQSNLGLADANPDLPVAMVYDKSPGQLEFVAKLAMRKQLAVVLPIQQGKRVLSKAELRALQEIDGVAQHICPVDAGIRPLGTNTDPDPKAWNCTRCDVKGGIGCFFGAVTKAVKAQAMRPADMTPQQVIAARIQDLTRELNEITEGITAPAGTARHLAAAGPDAAARVQGLRRALDGLMGELLGHYSASEAAGDAAEGSGGNERPDRGVQAQPGSHPRTIPIAKARDEDGNPLAKRGALAPSGYPVERLQSLVSSITARWTNAPAGGVHAVASVVDLPPALLAKIPTDALGDLRGLYDPETNAAYLVADRLSGANEAQFVLGHEVLGHAGLRAILGKEELATELNRLRMMNPALGAAARDQAARFNLDLTTATEEALADWQGEGKTINGWQRFAAKIQAALRAVGLHSVADWMEGKTQAETMALLARARSAITGEQPVSIFGGEQALRYSSDRAPRWQSALAEQLGKMPTKSAPAQQWINALGGLQAKGVKRDEIEWSGIKEWLQLQPADSKVTKEQVLNYLAEGGVKVDEVVKGEPDPLLEAKQQELAQQKEEYVQKAIDEARAEHEKRIEADIEDRMENVFGYHYVHETEDEDGNTVWELRHEYENDPIGTYETEEEAQAAADEGNDYEISESEKNLRRDLETEFDEDEARYYAEREFDNENDLDLSDPELATKFESWRTVPGGDPATYRELLLTMDDIPGGQEQKRKAVYDRYNPQINALYEQRNAALEARKIDDARVLYRQYEKLVEKRDMEAKAVAGETDGFGGDHWQHGNVLAHVRFDIRTNPAGESVLQVHEIQSDWAEQGRQKGFHDDQARAVMDAYAARDAAGGKKALMERMGEIQQAYEARTGQQAFTATHDDTPEFDASPEGREYNRLFELAMGPHLAKQNVTGLAPGPFVKKTEAWVSLALKRVMTYAAEKGIQHVALPTAEQINEAFSLENQVEIEYKHKPDGKVWLHVTKADNGAQMMERTVEPKELPGIVGKEVADKIMAKEGEDKYDPVGKQIKERGEPTGVHQGEATHYGDSWYIDFPNGEQLGVYANEKQARNAAERIRDMVREDHPRVLAGEDLKVGGEPMRKYYDGMVVNIANDLLKKFGGGRVQAMQFGRAGDMVKPVVEEFRGRYVVKNELTGKYFDNDVSDPTWVDEARQVSYPANMRSTAESWAEQLVAHAPHFQPGFTMTPALVERASQGLPLFSRQDDDGSTREKAAPGANVQRLASLLGPQLYGDMADMGPVTVKELYQNAFDALKGSLESGKVEHGRIDITTDRDARTITVSDNGNGMTPAIINKAFLTIAGTSKETTRSSGGFGIAKMLFLFGNKNLSLVTVRDGVEARLETTGEQLMAAFNDPSAAPEIVTRPTDAPNGTTVTVTLPTTYNNPSTGRDDNIYFPAERHDVGETLTRSPLFENITVRFNGRELEAGTQFPKDKFTTFSTVKFDWGTARIIVSKTEEKGWGSNFHVLSNGLWQFSQSLKENPFNFGGENVPRTFYINVEPRVKPEEPGYPFALNRKGFSPAVADDFGKIQKYLSVLYGANKAAETAAGFGKIEYVDADGKVSEPLQLAPKVDDSARENMLHINEGDVIEVHDGRMTVNGRVVPELTPDKLSAVKIDMSKFKIDQSEVDPSRPMIHDNVDIKGAPAEELALAEASANIDRLESIKEAADEAYNKAVAARDKHRIYSPEWEAAEVPAKAARQALEAARNAYWDARDGFHELKDAYKKALENAKPVPVTQAMREQFGPRFDRFLGDLGRQFMKLRDALVENDKLYVKLADVPVGVSFDQDYYGVHTMVPFRAMFLNPAMTAVDETSAMGPQASTKAIAYAMVGTMIHEIAHFREMNHSERFIGEMQRVHVVLDSADNFNLAGLKQEIRSILDRNHDIYSALNRAFAGDAVSNRGVKLQDGSSYSARDPRAADAVERAGQAGPDGQRLESRTGDGNVDPAGREQRGRAGGQAAAAGVLSRASWTPERVERLLDQYAYTNDGARTKAYAAWISPADYLALTTNDVGRIAREAKPLDRAELARQSQEIFLQVDNLAHGGNVVTGHEGRHRAQALMQAGVTAIPVTVYSSTGARLQETPVLRLDGQDFGHARAPGRGVMLTQATPITYDNRALLAQRFGRQDSGLLFSRREDSLRVAPNGKPSNLSARQWEQVRTPEFKAWFGDWENDPAKASKVLDENGEPRVVFHGTHADVSAFDKAKIRSPGGFWFAERRDYVDNISRADKPGFNQMPVFLNIRRPMDGAGYAMARKGVGAFDNASVQRNIRLMSRDGVELNNGRDSTWIALEPTQIKSAIANDGRFDRTRADILFSRDDPDGNMPEPLDPASHRMIWSTSRDMAASVGRSVRAVTLTRASNTLAHWRTIGLQFLGRLQLTDVYGKWFPQKYGQHNLMQVYSDLAAMMDAEKTEGGTAADAIVKRWGKLTDEHALATLMHDETRLGINAAKDYDYTDNRQQYDALRARWEALSPAAQAIHNEAAQMYENHRLAVNKAVYDRIMRSLPDHPNRASLVAQLEAEFFANKVKGVYFPLARFGDYVITVRFVGANPKPGQEIVREAVKFAETLNEAEHERAQLLKEYPPEQGYEVMPVVKRAEYNAARDSVGRGFVKKLFGVLDEAGLEDPTLQDTINQLILHSMPDLSYAKTGIHRTGMPGFSQDARRAFAHHMFHGANYLAKLNYSDQLVDTLDAMQKHVDENAHDPHYPQVKAQQVVDEMLKRHDAYMNPQANPLTTKLTAAGFLFYLGLSPASAMVNLLQTPTVALPLLAGKFGFIKSNKELLKASQQVMKGYNKLEGQITGDEKKAYDEWVRTGLIDLTMIHDLAGVAGGRDSVWKGRMRGYMEKAAWMFHHAELFNRQATALAAYRLARQKGMNHEEAYRISVDMTKASHFDYSAGNRPRFMQGPIAQVVFLFKQYAQNLIYTFARNAYLATRGDSVEKKEARKTLAGLLVTHTAVAGVLGLPAVTTLLGAASLLGSDDDDPWDAEVALRRFLADLFGPEFGRILAHGLSRSSLSPADISGRVGADHLLVPDVKESLQGDDVYNAYLAGLLGPVVGIGANIIKGGSMILRGDVGRGIETFLPAVVKGPARAIRYYVEGGAKDRKGITLVDDITLPEYASQMLGFTNPRVNEAQEVKSAEYDQDRALQQRRRVLLDKFAQSVIHEEEGDREQALGEIQAWNEKHPNRLIAPLHLMASVRNRKMRQAQAKDGLYLPGKRGLDARPYGDFGNNGEGGD